jgi:4-hydroxy-tetrahydrodipicolinate synthase
MPDPVFRGTGVALITPFDENLAIDYKSFEKVLQHTRAGGIDYFVVQGTTGESVTVTEEEKKDLLHFVRAEQPDKPIVFGIGGNDTQKILTTLDKYAGEKIDAILSVCPYYNKPSQAGLIHHFTLIADRSPFPVILYNVPGRTSVNLAAESVEILSQHPKIIGIKEASGNFAQCADISRLCPGDFLLISGDDLFTVPMMTVGAVGVISVLANALPQQMTGMVNAAMKSDYSSASRYLFQLSGINPLMYTEGNPSGVKFLMNLMGLCSPFVRPPLALVSRNLQSKITDEYNKLLEKLY